MIALALFAGLASADEGVDPPVTAALHGDVKSFFVSTFPYENELFTDLGVMPADPFAQGILDGRLKLTAEAGPARLTAHHAVTAMTPGPALATTQTGVGVVAPQIVDLSWESFVSEEDDTAGGAVGAGAMILRGRTDRLAISTDAGPLTLTVGRQPITLGHGLGFTPMDLVSPFFPTTVDQEYKPGVDAITADLFFGLSGQVSAMVAYVDPAPLADLDGGDWAVDGMVYALYAQRTFWRHDVGLLLGEIRGDEVVGLTVATYAGSVGLHGDATFTLPADPDLEDPFFRGVAGAFWAPRGGTTVTGEVYYQSLGTTDPSEYLSQLSGDRYARGELWLAGTTYASVALGQEITPLVQGSLALIANPLDPSALIAPGLTVSVSDEVQIALGGFGGLGERPAEVELEDLLDPETGFFLEGDDLNAALGVQSEFGFYPSSAYVQMKAYF